MGPVAGGVGILFLVARMVACNIIVLVLCVTTRRSHRHLYGQGVERRSYIDSPHRLLQVVSPAAWVFSIIGERLTFALMADLRCTRRFSFGCTDAEVYVNVDADTDACADADADWRMCGARATPLSVAVYVSIQMPVPMPHSMEGQKVQSWLIFCYLSAVHTDRTTVRE